MQRIVSLRQDYFYFRKVSFCWKWTSVESCMKCRQGVATPCRRLYFDSNSQITIFPYSDWQKLTTNCYSTRQLNMNMTLVLTCLPVKNTSVNLYLTTDRGQRTVVYLFSVKIAVCRLRSLNVFSLYFNR